MRFPRLTKTSHGSRGLSWRLGAEGTVRPAGRTVEGRWGGNRAARGRVCGRKMKGGPCPEAVCKVIKTKNLKSTYRVLVNKPLKLGSYQN